MTARRAGSMPRTATSQTPAFASSISLAIVVYSFGMNSTPASSASFWPRLKAVPDSSPLARFLLAITGLPVKRATRSTPRGASSVLMDGLGSVSRPAQPATSRSPTTPAIDRAALMTRLRLEDVDADEDHFGRALVLRPVGDVTRLGDHITGVVLLLVATFTALGQRALADVGERRAVLVAVDRRHPAGLERDSPDPELVARHVGRQVDRADELRVHRFVVLRRAHLADRRSDPEADQQRQNPTMNRSDRRDVMCVLLPRSWRGPRRPLTPGLYPGDTPFAAPLQEDATR